VGRQTSAEPSLGETPLTTAIARTDLPTPLSSSRSFRSLPVATTPQRDARVIDHPPTTSEEDRRQEGDFPSPKKIRFTDPVVQPVAILNTPTNNGKDRTSSQPILRGHGSIQLQGNPNPIPQADVVMTDCPTSAAPTAQVATISFHPESFPTHTTMPPGPSAEPRSSLGFTHHTRWPMPPAVRDVSAQPIAPASPPTQSPMPPRPSNASGLTHHNTHTTTPDPNRPATTTAPGLLTDRLGTLVQHAVTRFQTLSFVELCEHHRGRSCLTGTTLVPHPAEPILAELRDLGAPVHITAPSLTADELDAAVRRGAHKSTANCKDFLREEFANMMEAGQWLVLPYSIVRGLANLHLSPTGVVPQRDRRDRTIVDYSFYLVNQITQALAPDFLQFGHALYRILQLLQRADTRRGTTYLAKIDVADAFMRIPLFAPHIAVLGALLPAYVGEEQLVAFPMILPMGWIESPQYLCAVTETITDMANELFAQPVRSTAPHRLDNLADSRPPAVAPTLVAPTQLMDTAAVPPPRVRSRGPFQPPLNAVDVYMDDFILLSQLPRPDRVVARRTVFECIDSVLRPISDGDNPFRKEPNSTKKLAQGDAAWSTRKVILGWLFDTVERTIELPPHRIERLQEILASVPRHQNRTSRQKWQRLVGELRSMILAIPGGRGLFSQLQSVLTHSAAPNPSDRLRLSPAVHDQLDDFRWLAASLVNRPTRWGELVDSDPLFLGTVDASGLGMGGVWLNTNGNLPPLMWRFRFDVALRARLVSAANTLGDITNSDLEHAGTVAHQDILALQYDIREATLCTMTDNTAALSRELRGSTSVDDAAAYLCRLSSLHQRAYRYRPRISYIPGPLNVMADALSRRWDLTDSQLLLHFHTHFPQGRPWKLCLLRPKMSLAISSALSKQRCNPAFLMDAELPPPPTTASGPASVNNTTWSPTSALHPIQSRGFKSSLTAFELAGFRPAVTLSDLAPWRMPSASWLRRSPSWVNATPDSPQEQQQSTLDLPDS
jgi:hypothetical protein